MTAADGPGRFFGPTERAFFLSRPNRFTLACRLGGKPVRTFAPNPGRMQELLLPGATVFIESVDRTGRVLPYTAVAVQRNGRPVVIDTHRANDAAQFLLERDLVPGLEGSTILRREAARGRSRFDFLLRRGGTEILLEVKSCTLFGRRIAMFPDAVTARGTRHVEELASLSRGRTRGAVLFLVHASGVEYFLPEYHTDPAFSAALARARGRIDIIPLGLTWGEDLCLRPEARLLTIPWEILAKEDEDRGCYLLVLEVPVSCSLAVGSLGAVRLPKGFYVYTGSARGGLAVRIARHRRRGAKRLRWHIDHLRAAAELRAAYPIRASEDLECDLARAVRELAETAGGWDVPRFGSSDCGCSSHLFGFGRNPVLTRRFVDLLLRARIDRLIPGP